MLQHCWSSVNMVLNCPCFHIALKMCSTLETICWFLINKWKMSFTRRKLCKLIVTFLLKACCFTLWVNRNIERGLNNLKLSLGNLVLLVENANLNEYLEKMHSFKLQRWQVSSKKRAFYCLTFSFFNYLLLIMYMIHWQVIFQDSVKAIAVLLKAYWSKCKDIFDFTWLRFEILLALSDYYFQLENINSYNRNFRMQLFLLPLFGFFISNLASTIASTVSGLRFSGIDKDLFIYIYMISQNISFRRGKKYLSVL